MCTGICKRDESLAVASHILYACMMELEVRLVYRSADLAQLRRFGCLLQSCNVCHDHIQAAAVLLIEHEL